MRSDGAPVRPGTGTAAKCLRLSKPEKQSGTELADSTSGQSVQAFLFDILEGRLTTDAEIEKRAAPFWGYQGARYTVGYEMAALVDKRFGRKSFDECLLDPRLLLVRYNQVAKEANAQGAALETWSPELLQRLEVH